MIEPVKVIFKKTPNGKTYESSGYYTSEADFKSRNCTLIYMNLTTKTKPIPKKKESKDEQPNPTGNGKARREISQSLS